MTLLLGIFSVILGIVLIIRPRLGNWGSVNDTWQQWLYGEKGYYFLIRFVSGPFFVVLGVVLLAHWLNPYSGFFLRLNATASEELNQKYGFEEDAEWNFYNYNSAGDHGGQLRYGFYYPSFVYEAQTNIKLPTRALRDDGSTRIVVMDEAGKEERNEAGRVFHGEGYELEDLPAHLSSLHQQTIHIIGQKEYQKDYLVYELFSDADHIQTFYVPTIKAFVSIRVNKDFTLPDDREGDEGLWPYDMYFDAP